jgi:FlaA1/EpsC-like NDP-sugar epimerase
MSQQRILELIGRDQALFTEDVARHGQALAERIAASRVLVVGGAGSIGAAVVKELFHREPRVLHVVDTSENNLAELVRDIRSSFGYIQGEFRTLCLDATTSVFDAFVHSQGGYDLVLNFAALKHVRSEKDPFTLMRLAEVNVLGTLRTLQAAQDAGASKYFCVSTDKASNPVNMMGASKRIMELFLTRASRDIPVSSARFANVAFSDGSLPYAWRLRLDKRQPIAAPNDVRRYFVTDQEGAILCLLSAVFGDNCDLFFPKLNEKLHMITFAEMAEKYLRQLGYEPYPCDTEDEARAKAAELPAKGQWPCYFFASDTTGEKDFEEFYTDGEKVDWNRFVDAAVVRNDLRFDAAKLDHFLAEIDAMRQAGHWTKPDLVELFQQTLNTFDHAETHRYLDERM